MASTAQRHRGPMRVPNLADSAASRRGPSEPTVVANGVAHPAAAPSSTAPLAQVLTVDEVAALLRIERKTAYAAIQRAEIPGVRRIGSVIRVSRDAVLDWLAQGQGRVANGRRGA